MRKIKVLHYGLSYNYGGIESVVHSWFEHLPNDISFDFLNDVDISLAYQDEYVSGGSKIIRITPRLQNPIKHYFELKEIIEKGDYDYIHFHLMSLDEPSPIIVSNKSKHCCALYHSHTNYKGKIDIKEHVLRTWTKLLIGNKQYYRLSCGQEAGNSMFEGKPFEVIENGINFDLYKYSLSQRKEIRNKYNISENDILIGHVGNTNPVKNHPFLYNTFKLVLNEVPNLKLLMIGNMNESTEELSLIKSLGIENNVVFTGLVKDTSIYYSAMDLFYLPSLYEGVSISLIEAQASGLPCIISDTISKEVVISNKVLITSLDESSAVSTIKKAVNMIDDRSSTIINESYDINNSTNKLFNYYRNHLKRV